MERALIFLLAAQMYRVGLWVIASSKGVGEVSEKGADVGRLIGWK